MKNIIAFTIITFITCFAHAEQLKIGIVDVNKILKDAPQTLSANKKLEKEFSSRTSKLKEKVTALQADEKKYQKEALTMSDDQREKAEKNLQQRRIEIQRNERELREDMDFRRREEIGDLQEKVNATIDNIAAEQNYDLILYNGIAFASNKVDITEQIIKALGGGSSKPTSKNEPEKAKKDAKD
jgi:outer membrane protein